ncbi:acyl-CoA dehydrogenase family protein [Sphingorhabdus sp. 109]|jgi:alkylation response protein AidB-like acyl-CoA dehydrogenase|uniref:acyl-CoA dehydrogenase family protein n=1 Tax=Sphingorhabdus sp. 109 TaxID=2653173 RepID=UPI0012F12F1F|nr:acyl-CoA dehydrogenase family protein [Sphingorhabdus sp. 109]VWX59114.1 Flavin-dependent monooxygenase, oxygenase subunit HsaA [Sphingorhabdus sp. 109]
MSGLDYDISSIGEVGHKILVLLPEISARAEETEQARRLPADLAAKLAAAGAFNLSKPAAIGGLELDPLDFMKIVATVAGADASAGWCVMIAVTSTLGAAYMPEPAAREIFGADDVITGGVFAPMGKAEDRGDHYLLSGQWQWGSGSANCSWLGGGAMIFKDGELQKFDNGAPYHRMLFFPATEASFIDSWHVAGLKGTGSGDFSVEGVKVPKQRSVSFVGDRPRDPGALYKFPLFGLLALGVSSVALGNARAALEEIHMMVMSKKTPGGGRSMAQRATVQADLARATASLSGAFGYLENAIAGCWAEARGSAEISVKGRANLRLACAHATEISAEVCKTAYTLGGGSAVYSDNSLQRRFRDAHVATQHIATAPAVFELAGRVLLDQPADLAML